MLNVEFLDTALRVSSWNPSTRASWRSAGEPRNWSEEISTIPWRSISLLNKGTLRATGPGPHPRDGQEKKPGWQKQEPSSMSSAHTVFLSEHTGSRVFNTVFYSQTPPEHPFSCHVTAKWSPIISTVSLQHMTPWNSCTGPTVHKSKPAERIGRSMALLPEKLAQ